MNCYIDECLKDDVSKNLMAGGRFFGENLLEIVTGEQLKESEG